MTIGEQIKYIRSRRNITQNQLAQIVGVHPVTIRKYETNKLQPKKEHLSKIADALWVSPLVFRGLLLYKAPSHTNLSGVKSSILNLHSSDFRLPPNTAKAKKHAFLYCFLSVSVARTFSTSSSVSTVFSLTGLFTGLSILFIMFLKFG